MATNYFADNYTNQQRTVPDSASFDEVFSFTIPSAGFIINDTVTLAHIPGVSCAAGVNLLAWVVVFPALDSGTTVRVQLGDGTTADAFMTATLEGGSSAGTFESSGGHGVVGYLPKAYTTEVVFKMTISTAAAATTTSGTIKGYLHFNAIGIGALL